MLIIQSSKIIFTLIIQSSYNYIILNAKSLNSKLPASHPWLNNTMAIFPHLKPKMRQSIHNFMQKTVCEIIRTNEKVYKHLAAISFVNFQELWERKKKQSNENINREKAIGEKMKRSFKFVSRIFFCRLCKSYCLCSFEVNITYFKVFLIYRFFF